ncbi:hypothetical protein Ais01nite_02690 [Asanoa ishikariensis]|nr:hypothetical protein Ais01nite_02690 [Asanoa ishikariensis]
MPPSVPATNAADFVAALRALRVWADLTYRALAIRSKSLGHCLPMSTTASTLGRNTLPRREFVAQFVAACGLDPDQAKEWTAARDSLAAGQPAVARGASEQPATKPAATDDIAPAMLPPDVPDFTGRTVEADTLFGRLDRERRGGAAALPVAAVFGMAGSGKTALALHVAHRLAASYPDGQLWFDLGGAVGCPLGAGEVLSRMLRALGMPSRAIPRRLDERAETYRMRLAGRQVLVVLDNTRGEEQVRPLLPGTGTCGVLVTSRRRLTGIEGAHHLELAVFPEADALGLLSRIVGVERLRSQLAEAGEIVARCGRLPLAVRVAGARLAARPAWPLRRLAEILGDERRRLDQLATGDLAVRSSLLASYQDLQQEQQRLFRLLGLFDAEDFPGWLAAAVLGGPPTRAADHLEALVDAQLLGVAGVDPGGQLRYRFHGLVKLFAREQARAEESDECRWSSVCEGQAPA